VGVLPVSEFPSRCQHIKVNGTQCGSPALRRSKFCFFHKRFQTERLSLHKSQVNQARARRRAAIFDLPVLEDANSIQVSLMQIMRLLALEHLDAKTVGLLLYALQTASSNLRRTNFEPSMHNVVLDPRSVGDIPLGAHAWDDEDFADEEQDEESERAEALEAAQRKLEKEAKLNRWAEAEANRLGREGQAEREKEDREQTAREHFTRAQATKREADVAEYERTRTANPHIETGARRPPASVNMNEVREQVREQIKKALLPPG
jgi:hypothetical protein